MDLATALWWKLPYPTAPMASEVCIRTHHWAPVWLSHLTICARTQLKGSGDKARDGGASHHLSALSGANALLSPVYWRLFTVIHQPSLWPISDGETKGLVAGGCVQANMLKVGLGMDSLLCTRDLCLLADCEGAGGAGASRHQWRAIQRISISWQPTPVTPTLHPGVSRLHFRSWRLVITLDGGRT